MKDSGEEVLAKRSRIVKRSRLAKAMKNSCEEILAKRSFRLVHNSYMVTI